MISHDNKKNFRILAVNNEITLLNSLKRMLEKQHEVITVENGRAALELLFEGAAHFDVIISDLNMSEINGDDIYRFLAEKYPGFEQRIIFITHDMISGNAKEFLKNIKNVLVKKPFTREELFQALNAIPQPGDNK